MSNRTPRRAAPLLTAALFAMLSGCGGDPPKAQVAGTVTLNGVPIENGTIEFYPTGPTGQTAGGGIANGAYQLEASVGEMIVNIRAGKVVGKKKRYDTPDSPIDDILAETVPDQYNKLSKLKVTLKAGSNDAVNFELKSK